MIRIKMSSPFGGGLRFHRQSSNYTHYIE